MSKCPESLWKTLRRVKTRLSWSSGSQLWLGVIRLKTFSPDKSSPARCLLPAHPTPALLSSKSPASLSAPASCPPRCQEQQPALHPPRQVSSCFLPVFQCGAPTCPGVCLWNKILKEFIQSHQPVGGSRQKMVNIKACRHKGERWRQMREHHLARQRHKWRDTAVLQTCSTSST